MKLLVIEDYDVLRESLVEGLTNAGYAVDATGDGEEGLWYARDGKYDAVILDLMLPSMNGLTLLKTIRAEKNPCPVLILTAKDHVEDRVRGLNEGADDYVLKPFAFDELLARVNVLVRGKYGQRTHRTEVGGIEIDSTGRQVTINGQDLALTAREFAVLEVLALRAGEVVTRTEIYDHIYGFDSEPESNVVDVHIAQLRRKLQDAGAANRIGTRRGLGYILLAEGSACEA